MSLPRLSTRIAYAPRGSMQHVVTLLKPSAARSTTGEMLRPFIFATVRASVAALQGKDLERAQQVVAEVTHRIITPYQPFITSDLLASFRGRTFIIQAVQDPDERQVELHLLCRERNDGAPGAQ